MEAYFFFFQNSNLRLRDFYKTCFLKQLYFIRVCYRPLSDIVYLHVHLLTNLLFRNSLQNWNIKFHIKPCYLSSIVRVPIITVWTLSGRFKNCTVVPCRGSEFRLSVVVKPPTPASNLSWSTTVLLMGSMTLTMTQYSDSTQRLTISSLSMTGTATRTGSLNFRITSNSRLICRMIFRWFFNCVQGLYTSTGRAKGSQLIYWLTFLTVLYVYS